LIDAVVCPMTAYLAPELIAVATRQLSCHLILIAMRIQVLSDLHIEFMSFNMHQTDADVVVLAGDIHVGIKGAEWALENIKNCPVVYVLGNHEYYGTAYPKLVNKLKAITENTNVFILENNHILIEDTLFVGCTLWTDLELFGSFRQASHDILSSMNDFKKIRISPKYSKIKPVDIAIIHNKSLKWLEESIDKKSSKNLVVVTHHAPSAKSIPFKYKDDRMSPLYASNLDALIANSSIDLWIHGHVHDQLNYNIASTKIVCNPRGYPDEINYLFNPEMIIEI
jgi:predicted phosphodiesterase